MATSISWTDERWNPTTGCDKVSPGCGLPLPGADPEDHGCCYALTMAARWKAMGQPAYQRDGDPRTSGPGFGLTLHEDRLDVPLHWRKPRRVFVNSMSDLFHDEVPDQFIAAVFRTMWEASQHTFQVLTKRSKRMRLWASEMADNTAGWPLPNVWMGTSIEAKQWAYRADHLRATPAAVRWVSAEPLLGPLDDLDLTGIDWLVIGGESGPGARRMELGWVEDLMARCDPVTGPRVFVKQLGSVLARELGLEDPKGERLEEWPAFFQLREYPEVAA